MPDIDLLTPAELRERVFDAVEVALDRVDDVPHARDAVLDMARNVRIDSRRAELARAAIVAGAPSVLRAARTRLARRHAPRGLRVVPVVIVSRPFLVGAGVVGVAITGALVVRSVRARRRARQELAVEQPIDVAHDAYVESVDPESFDLEVEVERMDSEGGVAQEGSSSEEPASRRFARSAARGASTR
jgi:hypothetical protein